MLEGLTKVTLKLLQSFQIIAKYTFHKSKPMNVVCKLSVSELNEDLHGCRLATFMLSAPKSRVEPTGDLELQQLEGQNRLRVGIQSF